MYLFLMAHSSRIDANFLKGAPEIGVTINHFFKKNKGHKPDIAVSNCNASVLTIKFHHGLLNHWLELA
jgi:hypothetical protein